MKPNSDRDHHLTKGTGHIVAGVLGLVLSGSYAIAAVNTLSLGTLAKPGPAAFPILVAALIAISSLGVLAEQWSGRSADGNERIEIPTRHDAMRVAAVVLAFLVYLTLTPFLGHWLASILLCIIAVRSLSQLNLLWVLLTGTVIATVAYVFFALLLGVQLPTGTLGW